MVPFLPLIRNREYFISSKDLGYEYSYLLGASKLCFGGAFIFFVDMNYCFVLKIKKPPKNYLYLFQDQRLAESLRPYLEELQDVWPWLLLAGLCGGIITLAAAAAFLTAKRRYRGSPWLQVGRWKNVFALPERQPLIRSSDAEETKHRNYQTTI